jgi:hypothetical protein
MAKQKIERERVKSTLGSCPGWPLIIPPPVLSLTRDEEEKRLGYSSIYPPSRVKI